MVRFDTMRTETENDARAPVACLGGGFVFVFTDMFVTVVVEVGVGGVGVDAGGVRVRSYVRGCGG
jgi:hypothetical protein